MNSSATRVPVAPLPECPAVFKLTHTSIGFARKQKKQQRAITEPQELDRLAQSNVNLALSCPPLSTAAGPHFLTVHDRANVNLPPVLAQKRWKRSQARARTLAMSDTAHRMEMKQTAKMIGLSVAEFKRSKDYLENFIVGLRDKGDKSDEDSDTEDSSGHNVDVGLKQARRTRRLREKDARWHVYQDFSIICKQNIELKKELSKYGNGGDRPSVSELLSGDMDSASTQSDYGARSDFLVEQKKLKQKMHSMNNIRYPSGAEMLSKARADNGEPNFGIANVVGEVVEQKVADDVNVQTNITDKTNDMSKSVEVLGSRLFTSLENADVHSQEVVVPPGALADVRSVVRAAARVRMKASRVGSRLHSRSALGGSYASSNGSTVGSHYDNFSPSFGDMLNDSNTFITSHGDDAASGQGGDDLSRGWNDDEKSFGDSSGTDTVSLPTHLQSSGLQGGTQSRQVGAEVYVSDLSKLIHGMDYEVDASSMLNDGLDSPRSPTTNASFQQASYGHPNSPVSPMSVHNHDGVNSLLNSLHPSLKKAIRHLHDALVIRGLSVVVIADAAYLDQWHRGHSDMFLEVSDDGPPLAIPLEEAERMILHALSLSIEAATALKHRASILKKRREKATRRSASKIWLSTKDSLPKSMTKPEYLSPDEVIATIELAELAEKQEISLSRNPSFTNDMSPTDGEGGGHEVAMALEISDEEKDERGGEDMDLLRSETDAVMLDAQDGVTKKQDSFNFDEFYDSFVFKEETDEKDKDAMERGTVPAALSFSSTPNARARIVPGSKHAQREMQQARQEAFEAKKYPAYTKENARR